MNQLDEPQSAYVCKSKFPWELQCPRLLWHVDRGRLLDAWARGHRLALMKTVIFLSTCAASRAPFPIRLRSAARWVWGLACLMALQSNAASWVPAAADFVGRKGVTLYVSKQGDNSDGTSWTKALHSIQAALSAVPDNAGGHQIIIRPDTYFEANVQFKQPDTTGFERMGPWPADLFSQIAPPRTPDSKP